MNVPAERPRSWRATIHWLLIGLWVVAVAVALALAPSVFDAAQADWQVNEAARSLDALPYETLALIAGVVRMVLSGLMLVTAVFLLRLRAPAAWLAALALLALPFAFNLSGQVETAGLPAPWASLLGGLSTALGALGIASLVLLIFLFPDGHFFPAWIRWPALLGVAAVPAGIIALQFNDAAWAVFFLALLLTLLLAVAGQLLRFRAAGPPARRQTAGFLAFAVALPLWMALSFIAPLPLLNLVGGYAVIALLPVGLVIGVARGLWGGLPATGPTRFFAGAAALVVASALVAGLLWYQATRPQPLAAGALSAAAPRPVILDTDMGMDDISALLYLVQHPAVDLRAITVNGVAFAHCDLGVRNVLGLLQMAGAPDIPVSCGREDPYPGGRPAPDAWRKGADNLYGGQVRTGPRAPDPRPAAELLADVIRGAHDGAVVIALGPLTNLAEAFEADPSLANQVREIVIMGGAVDVPGNVASEEEGIDNAYAEWNIFADPVAADIVLASGAPVTLVPLDATNDVPFTRTFYQRLRQGHASSPATFVYNLLYMNQWWLDGGMYWWDTLTAAAALDESLLTLEEARLDVVTTPGPEMGRTARVDDGSPVRVATSADPHRFETLLLEVLNRGR